MLFEWTTDSSRHPVDLPTYLIVFSNHPVRSSSRLYDTDPRGKRSDGRHVWCAAGAGSHSSPQPRRPRWSQLESFPSRPSSRRSRGRLSWSPFAVKVSVVWRLRRDWVSVAVHPWSGIVMIQGRRSAMRLIG